MAPDIINDYHSRILQIEVARNARCEKNVKTSDGRNFYGEKILKTVLKNALLNFYDAHGRLPRIEKQRLSFDYVFLAKFVCKYPTNPNIADKLNTEKYVPERLRNFLFKPFRLKIQNAYELSRLNKLGNKEFLIKPSLGNGRIKKINGSSLPFIRNEVEYTLRKKELPYGYKWGEWLYASSPNIVIIEEDISTIAGTEEYQFYINEGKVRMFRSALNNNIKQRSESLISYCYFDKNGNHLPGTLLGKREHLPLEAPAILDTMYEVAEEIGKYVVFARVDFIPTLYGPYLNEITCFQGNARFECTNRILEDHHLDSMAFDFREPYNE